MSMENSILVKPNSDPSKIILFGISTIVIVFGIFLGWMALAPLATSIVAIGQVSADSNKKTIQHLEGGIIKKILVKDGDLVHEGDTLIILDDTQINSSLDTLQNQYLESIAALSRLRAQEKKTFTIDFPKEILEKMDDPYIVKITSGQKDILKSKLNSIKEESQITTERVEQFKDQIDGLNSVLNSSEERLSSIEKEIAEEEELFKERLVDIKRLRELKREKIRLSGEIENSKAEISRLHSQIDEANSQQRLRDKNFENEVSSNIVETRTRSIDLKSKIDSSADKLNRVEIKSPTTGYVTGLEIHTEGGVISPSKPILHIVPKDSELYIVAKVNTPDIDKLKKGLLADTRFSAFNVQQTFAVESKVIHVSADSFLDQQTGMSYYEAKLKLTKNGEEQLKANEFFLLPGMPVEAMIKTGDRTALSYLLKPFMDMLSRSFNEE